MRGVVYGLCALVTFVLIPWRMADAFAASRRGDILTPAQEAAIVAAFGLGASVLILAMYAAVWIIQDVREAQVERRAGVR